MLRKIDDIALIVGQCQAGTVASLLVQIAGKSGDKYRGPEIV